MKYLKPLIVPFILFAVSLYAIFPFINPDYIPAAGENPYGMNPYFINPFYNWQDKSNFGYQLSAQHVIYIYYLIWPILKIFSSIIHPTFLFIFSGYFLSSLFFYLMLKNLIKVGNDFWYLPPALLYSFNIYRLLIGGTEQTMLFIFLPLIFLCYFKFAEKVSFKYVCLLVLLSNISNAMSFNLAIFLIPYILIFSYFCFQFIYKIHQKLPLRKFLIYNFILLILIIASHLFWLIPMAMQLMKSNSSLIAKGQAPSVWNALGAGNFFDNFRFMGFWAFRQGYGLGLYFPMSVNYFKPLLVITSFLVVIFSYLYILFINKSSAKKKIIIYVLISSIVSYLLVTGIRSMIFGPIYNFLYDNINIVKIYREPYAKFMPLYIFFTSIGLLFSIYYVFGYLKNKYHRTVILSILCIAILINNYSLLTHEFMTKKPQNIFARSSLTKIPGYWKDSNTYMNKKKLEERIFITQKNSYVNSIYNWEYGINVSTDIANALIDKPSIKDSYTYFDNVITDIFDNKKVNLPKYLGFLSTKYILQENDLEWRMWRTLIYPPSKTDNILKTNGFNQETGFGKFTKEYLMKIQYKDQDEKINKEFFGELQDKPALVLYKAENDYFLPQFYTPSNILFIAPNKKLISEIISKDDTPLRTLIYFKSQNPEKIKSRISSSLKDNLPILEFKRINPTKYRIIVHKAISAFPLVFNQTFHDGWKLYLNPINKTNLVNNYLDNYKIMKGNENDQASKKEVEDFVNRGLISIQYPSSKTSTLDFISKNFNDTIQNNNLSDGEYWETWLKQPLDEKNHLVANGFANSWIIDPNQLCEEKTDSTDSPCLKNEDGTYDFEIVVEFFSQRLLSLYLIINATVVSFSIIYLLRDLILSSLFKKDRKD